MQQEALLFLAKEFIAADDTISAKEQDVIERMAREAGLQIPPMRYVLSHSAAIEALTTRKAQTVAMIELIGVAYADGEYVEEEKHYIQNLAEELGIPGVTVSEIEDWILRYIELNKEAEGFWSETP